MDYFPEDSGRDQGGDDFNPVEELGVPDVRGLFTQSFALRRQAR